MKSTFKILFGFFLLAAVTIAPTALRAQFINTMIGDGSGSSIIDGSSATTSGIGTPEAVFADKFGNVYVMSQGDNKIMKVDVYGVITAVVGSGTYGSGGDGGPALAAELNSVRDICIDTAGNMFILDQGGYVVRKIDALTGIISTICGTSFTWTGTPGDGGPAAAAELNSAEGLCVDRAGNIYIASTGENKIRMINTSGIINPFAGTGAFGSAGDGAAALSAELSSPQGIAVDTFGKVYIADNNNNKIRMVDALGIITTVAGVGTPSFSGDGASALLAELSFPQDVSVDQSGNNIYIADGNNYCIRKVDVATGNISTVAGTGGMSGPATGDGGLATAANCGYLSSVFGTDNGVIYLTESWYNKVRRVAPCVLPITTSPITGAGSVCAGASTTLSNSIAGGVWSADNGDVTIGSSSGIVTGVNPGSVSTISYALTNECGVGFSTTSIAIDDVPAPTGISGISTVCATGTRSLSVGTPGGTWSTSATILSVSGGVVTGIAAGTATVTYTLTNACGASYNYKIMTVLALPATGVLSGALSVCQTASTTLSSSTPAGGIWSTSATTIASVTGGGVVTGLLGGTAVISYGLTNSCGISYTTRAITVDPLPTTGTITGTFSTCELFTTSLANSIPGGTWSSANPSIATIDAFGVVTGVVPGTAIISYALTNLCGMKAAVATVTVVTTPVAPTIIGAGSLCNLTTTTLSNAVSSGAWSSSDPGVASISSTGVVTGNAGGTATISYAITNSCGTVNSLKTITVDIFPVLAPISGAAAVCEASAIALSDATPGGIWSTNSTTVATISNTGILNAIGSGTIIAYYAVTNSCGTGTVSRTITVIPLPAPSIVVVGKEMRTTKKYLTYQWSFEGSPIPGATSSSYRSLVPGRYSVAITDAGGCSGESSEILLSFLAVNNINSGNNTLSVFPNPNSGTFSLNCASSRNEQMQVTITNAIGQKVKEFTTTTNNQTTVTLNQPAGIYILSAVVGDQKYVEKITIQ